MSDENSSHFSNSFGPQQDEKSSLSKESYYSNISSKQSSTMGDDLLFSFVNMFPDQEEHLLFDLRLSYFYNPPVW